MRAINPAARHVGVVNHVPHEVEWKTNDDLDGGKGRLRKEPLVKFVSGFGVGCKCGLLRLRRTYVAK